MTIMQKTVFEHADIRQVEVDGAWPVTVVHDNSSRVEIEYSAYLENYLKINMEGEKLHVGFTGMVYAESGSVFRAVVHTPIVESVEAAEASVVRFEGGQFSSAESPLTLHLTGASICSGLEFSGNQCEITLEKASHLLDFQVYSENCEVSLSGASTCKGTFETESRLEAVLDRSAQLVTFGGSVPHAVLRLQKASTLNMVQTEVGTMEIALSGASEATVWVVGSLSGTLREASTLYYKGSPTVEVDCEEGSEAVPL